jgi:hypothetical protein
LGLDLDDESAEWVGWVMQQHLYTIGVAASPIPNFLPMEHTLSTQWSIAAMAAAKMLFCIDHRPFDGLVDGQ